MKNDKISFSEAIFSEQMDGFDQTYTETLL